MNGEEKGKLCFNVSDPSYLSPVNGDFRYQLFDDKYTFSTKSLSMMPDVCAQMDVDEVSDAGSSVEPKNIFDLCKSNEESETCKNCIRREVVQVECLETFENLREKCENQGLKFNDYCADIAYEVDIILSHKVVEESPQEYETFYYVKWKNYPCESNTWEPEYHLTGCRESIEYYHAMQSSNCKITRKLLEYFVQDLITRRPYDFLTFSRVSALCFKSTEQYFNSLQLTIKQMKEKMKEILNFNPSKLQKISGELFKIMQFRESRKSVLINLKEWENDINSKNENKHMQIVVENNVDLETAPSGFQFIHDYINTTVEVPDDPVAFCDCENCYDTRNSCCPQDSDGCFAYNKHRRNILRPGYPIYECNSRCKCGPDCHNRVVQHGQKVKVAIFRTANERGWGLRALETIEKGQFVLEYLGEIITSKQAEARGIVYDYIGRSYLFDLDYGIDDCCFTVDAGHVGNAAHFINHSCDPNLHVFAVWVENPDPRLPRLAFFSKRKIKRGEELTFDYKMVQKDRFGPQSPEPDQERILCRCNSKNCRMYLF